MWARFVGSRNAGRSRPSQDSPAPARGLYHGQAPRRFASSLRAFRPGFRFHCPDPNFSETKSLKHRNFLGPSLAWARQCQRPKATIDLRAYSVSNVARRCAFPAPNGKVWLCAPGLRMHQMPEHAEFRYRYLGRRHGSPQRVAPAPHTVNKRVNCARRGPSAAAVLAMALMRCERSRLTPQSAAGLIVSPIDEIDGHAPLEHFRLEIRGVLLPIGPIDLFRLGTAQSRTT